MTENTTNSNELRQFAADNAGRRKIDVEATLDLHRRAANQIDALSEHVNELRQRVASGSAAPAPAPAAPAGEDPSQSALMILQKAQQTADETLAEANQVLGDAERTRREADAMAQAKADTAIAKARVEAATIIEAAEDRANEVAAASIVAAERVTDAQRAYHSKASSLRADAEGVLALARSMETVAGEDLPKALTEEPFTEPIRRDEPAIAPAPAPPASAPAPVADVAPEPEVVAAPAPTPQAAPAPAPAPAPTQEAAPAPAPTQEAAPAPIPAEPVAAAPVQADLPPPPAAAEVAAAAAELPPPPAAEVLPPPPAPVAAEAELIDLTEAELEQALGGKSIDDELFGDDAVIDLTDESEQQSKSFQFFSRD